MLHKKNIFKYLIHIILLLFFIGLYTDTSFPETGETSAFEAAKVHFRKGFLYFNRNQYLSAVEFFRKAVSIYPEYYTAREYLARSYKLAGFLNEAIKEWEIIAGMSSNNIPVLNKLDALRYRRSFDSIEKIPIGAEEYVFSEAYASVNMGRYRFSKPIDMAIDSEKNVYITSFYSGKLVKLDLNGEGLSIFDRGVSTRFYGVDCGKDRIFVSDFKADVVHILDKDLKPVKSFGSPGNESGRFHGPKGISIDKDENIYVIDSGNNRVQKFDKDGNFILSFGTPGEYEANLDNPSGICVYNDTIYITDTGNKRIACFDDSGNFIKNISIREISNPRGISVYNKNLIISDEKRGLIFYSLDDEVSSAFSSWNKSKKGFSRLVAAHTDRDGILYCLDHNQESIYVFSPLRTVYTNFYAEITSIDANKYPVIAFYMNIQSRDGRPVYNLEKKNFRIIEDNATAASINVDFLKNKDRSMSAVICVDRSKANAGYHNDLKWVSDFILTKMRKNDSVQLLNFNSDAWVGSDFDWSILRTTNALRKRSYSEGKAVDKALYNAIGNLLPKVNRRGVVLITDGSIANNSFERYTPENIIQFAKSHYIPVYIIVFKEKDPLLKKIAEETGGGIYKASEVDSLRSIYNRIKESEEYRYVVVYSTYKTPSIKDWWSDVKIEIDYKGHRGVEWGGYFVP